MNLNVKKKHIGLAAYMKMKGCSLLGYNGQYFMISDPSNTTLEEWLIRYTNSCCLRHDTELLGLRNMVRNN